jgi:hypothetical protein
MRLQGIDNSLFQMINRHCDKIDYRDTLLRAPGTYSFSHNALEESPANINITPSLKIKKQ